MRNKDFIKKIVLDEINMSQNQGLILEAVEQWPVIQQIFKSNKIEPSTFRGMETYSYDDDTLGLMNIFSDGTAYLQQSGKIVPWTVNGQTIRVGTTNISLQNINTAITKNKEYHKLVATKGTATKRVAKITGIDRLQTVLDWLGIIPGFGDILDAINALIYFARGKYLDGILSLVAIIPVVGSGIKLSFKGAIQAVGGATTAARIWRKAATGNTDDLVSFYRTAIESGAISKLQLLDVAKYGDVVAGLLTSSKSTIKSKEAALSLMGVDAKSVLKQIDELIALVNNTTTAPIKKSLMSNVITAVKASKAAKIGKRGVFTLANVGTLGGLGVVRNLVRKLGISKREMGYLKDAMDLRFIDKVSQSPTITMALFKGNGSLKAAEAAKYGIPPWLQAKSDVAIRDWFVNLESSDPKKWKQVSEYIARMSATKENKYYMAFVSNKFQQASNIFRPGTVFKAGYANWIASALKLDSYRWSNPKNLDIVKNEIEDLAEKLGLDKQDDPNGVIMPAIFAAFTEFIGTPKKDDIDKLKSPGLATAGLLSATGIGTSDNDQNAVNSVPGSEVVDADTQSQGMTAIQTDFKDAEGNTTEKLNALSEKGYEESEIIALKRVLDID